MALILLDKSAWVRGGEDLLELGELCLCAVTRLEILFSARSPKDYARLEDDLSAFRDLRVDASTIASALGAQRELARRSAHRVPVPDLLIGACAQQHGAAVAHVDRHYDLLADALGFRSIRVDA